MNLWNCRFYVIKSKIRRLARELKQQDSGTFEASRSTNAAALSRLIGTAYSDTKCGLKTASRFAGGRGVKKRRVETCNRRYEQPESSKSDVEEFHMKKI